MQRQIIPAYQVFFMGEPKVFNGEYELCFPFLKARILSLVLLEEREIDRDKLCGLLWEKKPLEAGRRNLSNALSCIRAKTELFCGNARALYLNSYLSISRDTDRLNDLCCLSWAEIDVFMRPFMDGIDIKESVAFEEWLREKREYYQSAFIRALKKRAQIRQEEGGQDALLDAVTCYEKMAILDPYDESIHGDLTGLYIQTGRRVAATKVARDFSRRIESEFGIHSKRTRPSPFRVNVLKNQNASVSEMPSGDNPFQRKNELVEIRDFLNLYSEGNSCLCVWGEEGIGKTSLIKETTTMFEEKGWLCLVVKSFREERNYPMSPLIRLLQKLNQKLPLEHAPFSRFKRKYLASCFPFLGKEMKDLEGDSFKGSLSSTELNPILIAEIILEYISFIAPDACLIAIQEIQWMDETSWIILDAMIRSWGLKRHLVLSGYEESRTLLEKRGMREDDLIERLEVYLKCFNIEQTAAICKSVSPEQDWSGERIASVYAQTEGNPFLIREYLRFSEYSSSESVFRGTRSLFAARLGMLSDEERLFLEGVSIFPGEASLRELTVLLEKDPLRFARLSKHIVEYGLLREREEGGDVFYAFTHSKVRKLIVAEMSKALNNTLHRRRLVFLESLQKKSPADRRLYPQLFYHCRKLSLKEKELRWRLKELALHFQTTHEVFPVLSDPELTHYIPSLDDMEYTKQSIAEIRGMLDKEIRLSGRSFKLNSMERKLLTIEGGYLWWSGEYEDSSFMLKEALRRAIREAKPKAIIEACIQLCYLCIQTDEAHALRRYAKKIFLLAQAHHYHPWLGVSLRFLAISYIMTGEGRITERLLQMSTRLFEKIEEEGPSYTVSLIAAEHFKGDFQITEGNRRKALSHYLSCVRMGESLGLYRGVGLAMAKAGYCYLRLGNLAKSEEILTKIESFCAITRSDWNGSLQGGGIALSLLGLLNAMKGDWDGSRKYFQVAEKLNERSGRPTWRGIFLWSKSELWLYADKAPTSFVREILTGDRAGYCEEASRIFEGIGWVHEMGRDALQK